MFYFYRESDDNLENLKDFLSSDAEIETKFYKKIPDDFMSELVPSTIIVFDDLIPIFLNDKNMIELLYSFATCHIRHLKLYCFFVSQTISVLKKNNKLHDCISQSNFIICFRNVTEGKSLKRYLNNYILPLKDGRSPYEIYEKMIMTKKYSYLILAIGSGLTKNGAWSNILMSSPGPLLNFNDSDNDE